MQNQTALPDDGVESAGAIRVLLFTSVVYGLAFGIYEYESVLPLYLGSLGIGALAMGVMFAAAAVGVFLLRIYVGHLSDIFGRKLFYSLSLVIAAAANFATPLLPVFVMQAMLKTSREAATLVRDTMHSVLLYEHNAARFMGSLGLTIGAEHASQGVGSLAAGLLAMLLASSSSTPNYAIPFVFSTILLTIAAFSFARFYREQTVAADGGAQVRKVKLSLKLPPKLWLLVAFGFIFELGLFTTHCHVMPLYFQKMLEASPLFELDDARQVMLGVMIVMCLHRFMSGLAMMIASPRLKHNLKGLFVSLVFLEGVVIAATPFIGNLWIAVSVWLMHDMLGAAIWSPIHGHFIQKHSRQESRGADVSTVMGLAQLGRIAGPLLGGVLWTLPVGVYGYGAPFLIGGLIIAFSAMILLKL